MRAIVIIQSPGETDGLARAVAGRLSGAAVQIPFDQLLRDWIVTAPSDAESVPHTTAMQAKLLVAGYVKARYHVVLHGSFRLFSPRDDEAVSAIVRLMNAVPGVSALRVYVPTSTQEPAAAYGPPPPHDLHCDLERLGTERAAAEIVAALPVEAHGG